MAVMSRLLKRLTRPSPDAEIPVIGICDDKKLRFLGSFIACIVRLYLATLRLKTPGVDEVLKAQRERGVLISLWHRRIVLATYIGRKYDVASIASRSRDGELIAQVFTKLGLTMVRGSGRGGAVSGLKALLSLPQEHIIAVTPDCPRGPVFHLQPGIILLAQKTKRLLVPTSWKAKREFRFHSWDGFALPYPFTKATLALGDPIDVSAMEGDLEEKRSRVEKRMRDFEEETQRLVV